MRIQIRGGVEKGPGIIKFNFYIEISSEETLGYLIKKVALHHRIPIRNVRLDIRGQCYASNAYGGIASVRSPILSSNGLLLKHLGMADGDILRFSIITFQGFEIIGIEDANTSNRGALARWS